MSVLDKCRQITDTESGRVLLYRDEVEEVLKADERIEQLPTAQPEQRWIPCSERLPEEPVLCCSKVGTMIIGLPVPNNMSVTGYNADGDVCLMPNCVAWMPLPEPYTERRTT